ncbi:hypothetical protein IF2G_11140 [Cordyceps javanica]|nr:hypothetical protein IF2G_11140 [Cordyceps javanica]
MDPDTPRPSICPSRRVFARMTPPAWRVCVTYSLCMPTIAFRSGKVMPAGQCCVTCQSEDASWWAKIAGMFPFAPSSLIWIAKERPRFFVAAECCTASAEGSAPR